MTVQNATALDYKKLISERVKLKYPSLIVGIIVSYFFALFIYNHLPAFKFLGQNKVEGENSTKKIQPKIYVVQEGDDLWKISEKIFGSGYNAYDISIANKITNPDTIVQGQKLIIPSIASKQSIVQGDISATMTSQVSFVGDKYTVKPGDFLWKIALEVYGDGNAWEKLADFNHIGFPYEVEAGTILNIPR